MPSKGHGKLIFRKFGPKTTQQYGRSSRAPSQSCKIPELPELEEISDTEESQQYFDDNEIPEPIVANHGGLDANGPVDYDKFTNQEWNEAHKSMSLELAYTTLLLKQARLEIARLKGAQELSGSISCPECRRMLKRKEPIHDGEEEPQQEKRVRISPREEQSQEGQLESPGPSLIQQLPAVTPPADTPHFSGYTAYFEPKDASKHR
ncbi:hypothetical protein DdX_07649 [Ditylenchus destructor]|uniref:Uncharacterized protein n=1 Tax=Ditylenchus destructor TaxID=166010 RepID=A0AAD4N912_9BILA|nr:hypothetical protein DdX_07649 [Ditylenchus destructor]